LDVFTFAADAGNSVTVAMGVIGTAFDPQLDLYAPGGALLKSVWNYDFNGGTALDVVNLPQSGTYYVVARDHGGDDTGSYSLTMARFPGAQDNGGDAGTLASGATRSATIGSGDLDVFSFGATAGDKVSLALEAIGTSFDPQLDLYAPSGALLKSAWNYDFNGTVTIGQTSLPQTGTYYVVARDHGGEDTGSYNVLLSGTVHPPTSSTGSIGGTLWNDLDADGVKDTGEGGLASWKVFVDLDKDGVLDAGEKTATTDSGGNYKFTGLPGGSYRVREVISSGWRRTSPGSGYYDVTLTSGQNVTGKNFGNTQKVLISGSLFNDLDADGLKDSGEAALANWKVFLDADKDGVWDSTEKYVLTDSAGNYSFKTLASGTYRVREVMPSGWRRTTPSSGYFDLTLSSGGSATSKNFGNTQKILISGTVFNDLDGDRVKDLGEAGLSGWKVFIDSDGDGVWDSTEKYVTTDSSGNWSFKTLTAGTYKVRVVQQTGWKLTTPSTTPYHSITLSSGGSSTGKLFGEKKIA
jgi:hypothetical protein